MICKELGRTGVLIPEVGIGTWNYHAGVHPLRCGLDAGALFLDTAESYGTEAVVGEAVKGVRKRVFIATKVSPQNYRQDDLRKSVDASISRLGIETIDLLQLHHPNPAIPIQETMGAMSELVDAGKIRFIGVSNFSLAQLQEARIALTKHPIVSNQVRYNVIDRTIEKGLLPYCQTNGITVIAYSPLARGLSRITDCDPDRAIPAVARITGKSCAQVVLNWCLCKDNVVIIPGANSKQHVLENCGASDWRMTDEHANQLDTRIRFRHRTGLDALLRRHMPRSLERTALGILKCLPPGLRRRLT